MDIKYPGPAKLDPALAPPRNKPLAKDADPTPGPTVVPGDYQVELALGPEKRTANFAIVKDPRLATTPDAYGQQFALLRELTFSLGRLNSAVNRIRRIKRALAILAEPHEDLAAKAKTLTDHLASIEGVLVDVHRQSARDVLRNPAGLDDTLIDLINTVAVSDNAPTVSASEVSREVMAHVDAELAKLDALAAGELAALNRLARAIDPIPTAE